MTKLLKIKDMNNQDIWINPEFITIILPHKGHTFIAFCGGGQTGVDTNISVAVIAEMIRQHYDSHL